jgi:hypothetical protein
VGDRWVALPAADLAAVVGLTVGAAGTAPTGGLTGGLCRLLAICAKAATVGYVTPSSFPGLVTWEKATVRYVPWKRFVLQPWRQGQRFCAEQARPA